MTLLFPWFLPKKKVPAPPQRTIWDCIADIAKYVEAQDGRSLSMYSPNTVNVYDSSVTAPGGSHDLRYDLCVYDDRLNLLHVCRRHIANAVADTPLDSASDSRTIPEDRVRLWLGLQNLLRGTVSSMH